MNKIMKRLGMFALIAGLTVGISSDAFARGSRSSSSRSSSSRSSSSRSSGGFGYSKSSKPKTVTKRKAVKPSTGVTKTSTKAKTTKKSGGGFGTSKKVDTGSAKYKSVNSKITKNFGTSTKKYKSKSAAKADLSTKMANKKYDYKDSKTAMSNRPDNIPKSYQGNTTVYVGGRYGYSDPMGNFMAYTAMNMIVTDMMVHSYAPHATYHQQPVVVHRSSAGIVAIAVVFIFVFVGVFIVTNRR